MEVMGKFILDFSVLYFIVFSVGILGISNFLLKVEFKG